MARKLFSKEEIRISNVNGKQGHQQLDLVRISFIKKRVLRYYSIPESEQTRTWKRCTIAIDERCRRLRRPQRPRPLQAIQVQPPHVQPMPFQPPPVQPAPFQPHTVLPEPVQPPPVQPPPVQPAAIERFSL
ncbi:gibberellin-regulated protein 14-like [Anneissia japonica]|uniref:gibberellin-regulated protein 14-like n=1 Tax=Anneissia japonica TaxID=1529436 RepID=UPI0014258892|nr:gibberellin-regulated protein 14-like [Anneissia japonica]